VRIGFLQFRVRFGKFEANRDRIESLLGGQQFDLLVLPELCLSGYFMPSREHARKLSIEYESGETFEFIREIASRHDGAVVFGFPERAGDRVYNSAAVVLPDGSSYLYRKVHLFNLEKSWFDPGDLGFPVFEFRGARIGLMICFDWIFPEACRTLALKSADIVCHPSNLVMRYCQDAMITRSLENSIFSITCNRIGTDSVGDQSLTFTGSSQITDSRGRVLVKAQADSEEVRFVEIDPQQARNKLITEHNDLLADRRPEAYR
jgi:predicted amidohydrolase